MMITKAKTWKDALGGEDGVMRGYSSNSTILTIHGLNRWQRDRREVCTRRPVSQAWSPHGKASMVLFGLSFMLFLFFCLPLRYGATLLVCKQKIHFLFSTQIRLRLRRTNVPRTPFMLLIRLVCFFSSANLKSVHFFYTGLKMQDNWTLWELEAPK